MRASLVPQTFAPDFGLTGLEVKEELGRGAHSVVYLAAYRDQEVAIKVCAADKTSEQEGAILRFRREGAALARLSHRGLARVLSVGMDPGGRAYIMLEHVSGEPLSERIAREALSEADAIKIAVELAGALSEVHRRGLVHRDVKPDNIMLDKTGAPKLIDFGLAFESDDADPSDAVVGTFAYSPPEQTGMVRRRVDARSDLYSLGVVMFECVTGTLPFESDDVGRLIQMHAVDIAPRVRSLRPALSPAIDAVIAKLLAKDPDDRYPSAESLVYDLEHLAELSSDLSELGRHRAEEARAVTSVVVGRSIELAELRRAAAEARAGRGALVSLIGEPGTGASHLARAWLANEQNSGRVIGLWASCATESETPLGALRSALASYVRGADRSAARTLFSAAAGEYAACLSVQFPSLAPLLGDVRLGAGVAVSQELGYEAVCRLLSDLARATGLLILVFDESHKMDSATRNVLERLLPRLEELPIVVLCTSVRSANAADADNVGLSIELAPLDLDGVAALASEFLNSQSLDPVLTQQLHARTGGSPRGVLELLRVLLDRGLLTASWGHWSLDGSRLHDLPLPESVEKLALDRLLTLPVETRTLLRLAAVVGKVFEVDTLIAVGELSRESTQESLRDAVEAHLIERLADDGTNSRYAFLHAQVEGELLSELEPTLQRDLHRIVAQYFEKRPDSDTKVFDVAKHWALGADRECAAHALSAVSVAGQVALVGLAYSEAERWFQTAFDLATAHGLECDYRIHRGLAEVYVNSGRVPEARHHFSESIARCQEPVERAHLHLRLGELCMAEGWDTQGMKGHLLRSWEALGEEMPAGHPVVLLLKAAWILLCVSLASVFGWGFGSKANDPASRVKYKLIEQTGGYAFMTQQLALLIYLLPLNAMLSYRIGPSRELIWARAARAHALSTFGTSRKKIDAIVQTAYELADQLGDTVGRARAAQLHASAMFFTGDIAEGERASIDVLQRYGRILDVSELVMCTMELCSSLNSRGHYARAKIYLDFAEKILRERSFRGDGRSESMLLLRATIDIAEGRFTTSDASVKLNQVVLGSPKDAPLRWFMVQNTRLNLLTESDDFGPGFDRALALVDEANFSAHASSWHQTQHWHIRCVARYRQYLDGPKADAPMRLAQFQKELKNLTVSTRRPDHRWMVVHAQALDSILAGQYERALTALSEAERLAQVHDSPRGVFMTRVDRAVAMRRMGHTESATMDVQWALAVAEAQGWVSIARALRRRFQVEASHVGSRPLAKSGQRTVQRSGQRTVHHRTTTTTTMHTSVAQAANRERDALLELSLAAAERPEPEAQAHAVLQKLLSVLGGEHAFVFLWDAEKSALSFYAGRDAHGQKLDEKTPYARSLVERVASSRTPIVLSGTEEGVELGSKSVVAQDLRSMICAPLTLRNELLGVVYLDSRLVRGVFTENDLSILVGLANHIAIAHAAAVAAERELERRAAERDLELSAAVQGLLLPKDREASWDGLSLAAHFKPASSVAGDWWYYDRLQDGTIRIVLGDVTGHGAAAAMVSAVVAGWYRRMRLEDRYDTPEMMRRLHEGLRDLCGGTYLMPMLAVELRPGGELQTWSAAAPPMLIRRADSQVEVVQQTGTPLGGERFDTIRSEVHLEPGDRVLVASDGLFELPVGPRKILGIRRVRAMFATYDQPDVRDARNALAAEVDRLAIAGPEDDITFVIAGR